MATRSEEEEETHDNSSVMYFLDVLTSGLGAAVLLFIVFSVLPHYGDSGAKSKDRGQDPAAGPPVGAAADPVESLARHARITLSAKVEYQAVPTGAGRWKGVPLLQPGVVTSAEESEKNSPNERLFLTTCERGISPAAKILFELLDPPSQTFTLDVRVGVGGLVTRRKLKFTYVPVLPAVPGESFWDASIEPPPKDAKPVRMKRTLGQPLTVVKVDLQNRRPPAKEGDPAGPYDWILIP